MKDDDFFIVLNPDVYIESSAITKLVKKMESEKVKLATINLYKDFNKGIYDSSIRSFPTFKQFVYSFVGLGNTSIIDKANIYTSLKVNWAAGSFLAFTSEHYRKLKGFDEQYFMYCEDIDICYRSYSNGNELTYYPDVDAVHLAKHQNRKIFSMHFYWHVSSVFRFLFKKSLSR
nr:hypothetical protein [Vibrio splendidus]